MLTSPILPIPFAFLGNHHHFFPAAPCNHVSIAYLSQFTKVNPKEDASFDTVSICIQKEYLVLFPKILCATVMFCAADPADQSQPATTSQVAEETQPAQPVRAQTANRQSTGVIPATDKKLEPQLRVAYRPQADRPKAEPKPERKAEQKLELLAIEQSIVDCTN